MANKVKITVFRWAGAWGPFKVKIPCGECALTLDIIQDVLKNELDGIDIELDIRDWLTEWWKPLIKGGWHAPIVMVNGRVISQGARYQSCSLGAAGLLQNLPCGGGALADHVWDRNLGPG